jgi:hypothetical protein
MFWLARNRIVDPFSTWRIEPSASEPVAVPDDGEEPRLEEVPPSPAAGPAEAYARSVLMEELVTPGKGQR